MHLNFGPEERLYLQRAAYGTAALAGAYVILPALLTKGGRGGSGGVEGEREWVHGLYNPMNDCFINSVVQCLAGLPSFRLYLRKALETSTQPERLRLTAALLELLTLLNTPLRRRQSSSARSFVTILGDIHNSAISRNQQDAQEFLNLITETLLTEWSAPLLTAPRLYVPSTTLRSYTGTVRGLLHRLRSRDSRLLLGVKGLSHTCRRCKHTTKTREEAFTQLSLPVPPTYDASLDECLRGVWADEPVEGYSCTHCALLSAYHTLLRTVKGTTTLSAYHTAQLEALREAAGRQMGEFEEEGVREKFRLRRVESVIDRHTRLLTAPGVLVIHLNRSVYLPNGDTARNPCHVSFGEKLSLGGVRYKLRSMITHTGSHSFGHFIAWRRVEAVPGKASKGEKDPNKWWRMSDEDVKRVGWGEVRRQTRGVYLLMYEREEKKMASDLGRVD
ncbi:hypothetical protein YB2330_006378 [Saitoella coloradoensis]